MTGNHPEGRVLLPLAMEGEDDERLRRNFARSSYISAMVRHHILPILVSPNLPESMVEELYGLAQGLFLIGGHDVDAAHYNQKNHKANVLVPRERDLLELSLVKRAVADKLPILAICRGCQVLAVASGGDLHQHVPEISSGVHRIANESYEGESLFGFTHRVNVTSGTRLASIIGKPVFDANSSHHQSVKSVGQEFLISGTADDGIVEAIEHKDANYFCLGVQSHPEALTTDDSERIFGRFADAVRERMKMSAKEKSR